MTISCICIAVGRNDRLSESIASFLSQDYEDKQLLIVNTRQAQTLIYDDDPRITVMNVKQQCLPVKAANWAVGEARGEIIVRWDENSIALPGWLSSIAEAIATRPWCFIEKELVLETTTDTLRQETGSEFCFAFKKSAWQEVGTYGPGINGSSDRNFVTRLTAKYPGENTAVRPDQIQLIRVGSKEERENAPLSPRTGQIKLAPVLEKDYQGLVEMANKGKRESEVCVVSLGRNGDIIGILPILKEIHDKYKTPHLMVSAPFAGLLDGVSYVKAFPTQLDNSKLGAAISIAKSSYKIVLVGGVWGEGWSQIKRTPSYNQDSWSNLGFLHRFDDETLKPVFDRRDMTRERELLDKIRGSDKRPMILVNVSSAISSPCPECAALLPEIKKFWSDYNVVDLTQFKAHRLYDFLLTFESSAALVCIDTSFLHLVSATDLACVAIVNHKGERWASTKVRCGNAVAHIPYDEVNLNERQMLHESILAALQRHEMSVDSGATLTLK